jgi:hypothetical protein|tara:strand:- start:2734 stop:3255 length:522 start_codon:yes stop_codon:yes gene_type:complete
VTATLIAAQINNHNLGEKIIVTTTTEQKPKMTAEQATTFERTSIGNARTVAATLKCGCIAYETVFNLRRWNAQGYKVKRGQKGIRLTKFNPVKPETEEEKTQTIPKFTRYSLFCWHQVEPFKATTEQPADPTPTPTPTPRRKATVKAQQPIVEPAPVSQPQIDAIMGNWKEVS